MMIKSRRIRVGHVTHMGQIRNFFHRIVIGKPTMKRFLRASRSRQAENIKMDLKEIEWRAWIGLFWLG
jgi:hypothetical protein